MHLVYGFEASVSPRTLPHAVLLVDILSEWPQQNKALRDLLDRYGGTVLFRTFPCSKNNLCDLCREWKWDDRDNLHRFLDTVREQFGKLHFRTICELAKFATTHGSQLFKKRSGETTLPSHLRLKYK